MFVGLSRHDAKEPETVNAPIIPIIPMLIPVARRIDRGTRHVERNRQQQLQRGTIPVCQTFTYPSCHTWLTRLSQNGTPNRRD